MSFAVASTASLRAPVAVRGDASARRRTTRVTVGRPTVNTSKLIPPVTWSRLAAHRCTAVSTTSIHADPAALPSTSTIPLNAQASLSPSHPAERASIVKTVVDRIAGASLAIAATVAIATSPASAIQMGLPEEEVTKLICDAACETTINDAELVTTQSGLQYRDIKVGDGVQPEIGFQVGKFILILVWAIGLTSCFVYSRRLHREKRARTGEFIFISVRAIGLLTPCLFNQRTDLRQLPGKGKAERYSHHRTRTGRRHERHPRAGRGHPNDAIGRYQEALHPGRAGVPQRSGIGAGKLIFSFIVYWQLE